MTLLPSQASCNPSALLHRQLTQSVFDRPDDSTGRQTRPLTAENAGQMPAAPHGFHTASGYRRALLMDPKRYDVAAAQRTRVTTGADQMTSNEISTLPEDFTAPPSPGSKVPVT
jgi:hypothetical protein